MPLPHRFAAIVLVLVSLGCTKKYFIEPAQLKNIDGYERKVGSTGPGAFKMEELQRGEHFKVRKNTFFRVKLKQDAVIADKFEKIWVDGELIRLETRDGEEYAVPFSEIDSVKVIVPKNALS